MTCKCKELAKQGLSVAKKILSADRAALPERTRRIAICMKCELMQLHLARRVMTCGRPFDGSARDDQHDGCGCVLTLKAALLAEKCPRGRWEMAESEPPLNNCLQWQAGKT